MEVAKKLQMVRVTLQTRIDPQVNIINHKSSTGIKHTTPTPTLRKAHYALNDQKNVLM